MMGMSLVSWSTRYWRTKVSPSTPGMTRSCKMTVGLISWAALRAPSPAGGAVTASRSFDSLIAILGRQQSMLVTKHIDQLRRDAFQRQDVHCGARFGGGFGHAVNRAAGLVLRDGVMAFVTLGFQAQRAVAPHAGQQHAHDLARPEQIDALEKNVDRWAVNVIARLRGISKAVGRLQHQVVAGAGKQHGASRGTIALLGHPYRQNRLLAQPLRHSRGKLFVHVLNDDN